MKKRSFHFLANFANFANVARFAKFQSFARFQSFVRFQSFARFSRFAKFSSFVVFSFAIFAICFFSCTSVKSINSNTTLNYAIISPTKKVLQYQTPNKNIGTQLELFCAKGESESSQIVFVQTAKTEQSYRLVANPLVLQGSSSQVLQNQDAPKLEIDFCKVGYVPVKKVSLAGNKRLGDYPDVLIPQDNFSLKKGFSQGFFYTVYVPYGSESGIYTSTIDVYSTSDNATADIAIDVYSTGDNAAAEVAIASSSDTHATADVAIDASSDTQAAADVAIDAQNAELLFSIPVCVKVFNVEMPKYSKLKTLYNRHNSYSPGYFETPAWTKEKIEYLEEYYYKYFRINTGFAIDLDGVFYEDENGKLCTNMALVGEQIERRLALGINTFRFPLYASKDILTPEKEAERKLLEQKISLLDAYLAQNDYDKYFVWYNFDEPKDKELDKLIDIFDWGKEFAPHMRSCTTLGFASRKYRKMEDHLEVWVPHITQYETKFFPRMQKEGDEVWIYTCIQTCYNDYPDSWKVDTFGTCQRSLGWWLYKYNIDGYLYWAINYWKKNNPYENIETFFYGNGDGALTYPSLTDDPFPYNSIRLHNGRDGFEDFDLLKMLENALLQNNCYTEAEVKEINKILKADDVIKRKSSYTKDDYIMIEHHTRILELLEKAN